MKKIIFALLVLTFSLTKFYSQDDLNIEQGKKYKLVLFDDSQVIGLVVSVDEKYVKVQTRDQKIITVPKENILFVTTDLTPDKYDYSISLTGGVSFLNDQHYYYYNRESIPGPHINLSPMFYISGTKAVKVDLSYSYAKPKFDNDYYNYYSYENQPPEPDKFEGGETSYITFKPSFVLGQLQPENKVMAYGYIGLGVNYFSRNAIEHTYYYQNYPDTTFLLRTEHIERKSGLGAVLGIGGGLGFKISRQLSIQTELEFNILTVYEAFRSYIPLRIGLNYLIY